MILLKLLYSWKCESKIGLLISNGGTICITRSNKNKRTQLQTIPLLNIFKKEKKGKYLFYNDRTAGLLPFSEWNVKISALFSNASIYQIQYNNHNSFCYLSNLGFNWFISSWRGIMQPSILLHCCTQIIPQLQWKMSSNRPSTWELNPCHKLTPLSALWNSSFCPFFWATLHCKRMCGLDLALGFVWFGVKIYTITLNETIHVWHQ